MSAVIPKGKQVFPGPPKWYQCSHRHVSGRRCKRTALKQGGRCQMCLPVNGSPDKCPECFAMMRAFGLKP